MPELEAQFQCLKLKPVLLTASSIQEAVKLKQHVLDYQGDTASTADHGTAKTALKNRIFIGKVTTILRTKSWRMCNTGQDRVQTMQIFITHSVHLIFTGN